MPNKVLDFQTPRHTFCGSQLRWRVIYIVDVKYKKKIINKKYNYRDYTSIYIINTITLFTLFPTPPHHFHQVGAYYHIHLTCYTCN